MAPIPNNSRGQDFTTGNHGGTRHNTELDRLYANDAALQVQQDNVLGLNATTASEVVAARNGQASLKARIDQVGDEVVAARSSSTQGAFASLDARMEADEARLTQAITANSPTEVADARADVLGTVAATLKDAINKGAKDLSVLTMQAVSKVVASSTTVKDVFIYDTSKDSDGGAWRKRTQHTSWYNETLNTAIRGKTREFPAVALIVAETTKVTIYDLTDPTVPMWMVVNVGATMNGWASNAAPVSIYALNGTIYAGTGSGTNGIREIRILQDNMAAYTMSGLWAGAASLALRNGSGLSTAFSRVSSNGIVNDTVNDVTATILPGAPIDPATGLPMSTVAVATAGGVSVIKHNGTVVNIVYTGYEAISSVTFNPSNEIGFALNGATNAFYGPIPASSVTGTPPTGFREYFTGSIPAILDTAGKKAIGSAIGGGSGLSILAENPTIKANGMVAYVTKDFVSGWLPGDIRRAWLAQSATADRSVKNKSLTQYGTITASPVASGADLLAYSGFGASNYLEEPYSADLDFGTGDFAIFGWLKEAPNSAIEVLLCRGGWTGSAWTGGGFIQVFVTVAGNIAFAVSDDNAATDDCIISTYAIDDSAPHLVVCVVRSGKLELWVDGVKAASDVSITNANLGVSNASATLKLGAYQTASNPLTNGAMALWRATAFAPSADQIAQIYNQERMLFQDGAKCILGGSSNTIAALDYDPDTDRLAVATGNGVSYFMGLSRVDYLAKPLGSLASDTMVSTAARRGMQILGTTQEAYAVMPQRNARELHESAKPIGSTLATGILRPTLLNSWVDYGATQEARYYRDASGIVRFDGIVKSGAVGTVAFTLPAGFRPRSTKWFPIVSNSAAGIASVAANGDVTIVSGNTAWASLDAIAFLAEA